MYLILLVLLFALFVRLKNHDTSEIENIYKKQLLIQENTIFSYNIITKRKVNRRAIKKSTSIVGGVCGRVVYGLEFVSSKWRSS